MLALGRGLGLGNGSVRGIVIGGSTNIRRGGAKRLKQEKISLIMRWKSAGCCTAQIAKAVTPTIKY